MKVRKSLPGNIHEVINDDRFQRVNPPNLISIGVRQTTYGAICEAKTLKTRALETAALEQRTTHSTVS